jgi:hypothetical protein
MIKEKTRFFKEAGQKDSYSTRYKPVNQ